MSSLPTVEHIVYIQDNVSADAFDGARTVLATTLSTPRHVREFWTGNVMTRRESGREDIVRRYAYQANMREEDGIAHVTRQYERIQLAPSRLSYDDDADVTFQEAWIDRHWTIVFEKSPQGGHRIFGIHTYKTDMPSAKSESIERVLRDLHATDTASIPVAPSPSATRTPKRTKKAGVGEEDSDLAARRVLGRLQSEHRKHFKGTQHAAETFFNFDKLASLEPVHII